ncbi:hypothetical protein KIL84_020809 [Mauremys mutica]|uniref:Uncharacterized protein n=1 Tax=Mauremys mutica TaxID=74926 RepID=A0A9D3XBP6_9SAUR|nr:hypothetical protein KIL84_020809 [Mauremys mutica]
MGGPCSALRTRVPDVSLFVSLMITPASFTPLRRPDPDPDESLPPTPRSLFLGGVWGDAADRGEEQHFSAQSPHGTDPAWGGGEGLCPTSPTEPRELESLPS